MKSLVTVSHAASVLSVSPGLIYKLRVLGAPGIFCIGRSVRVDLDELVKHVRGNR